MTKEKSKLVRSISIKTETYEEFKRLCFERGYIMSVQLEHMMTQFIEENGTANTMWKKVAEKK